MNKWSTSLPSIISLYNDVQLNFDSMIMQQSSSSSNRNLHDKPLNDISINIHPQPMFINFDKYPNNYNQLSKSSYEPSIQNTVGDNVSTYEQFVPESELLQSLVAYADSFDIDVVPYPIENLKDQPITISPIPRQQTTLRRRAQSSTANLAPIVENGFSSRHKSCDDLSIGCSMSTTSRPTSILQREQNSNEKSIKKFVPSPSHPQFLFSKSANDDNDAFESHQESKPIEEGTTTASATVTSVSKLEWELSSDTMNDLQKPVNEYFNGYEASSNIGDINSHYLKDLERFSYISASMDFAQEVPSPVPPPPVIIRKKSKDIVLKQPIDIQLLRPPTPPPPAPIIIREIHHKPTVGHTPITIHQQLENTGQIRLTKTPSPIVIRERPPIPPKPKHLSKPTIIYRHIPNPSPSPPTVIVERLRPNIAALIKKPPPILVERWLPYPPEQKRKVIYERLSPIPIRNKRHANGQGRKIIVEYDDINVIVDKDIKQRREIKRVSPSQYVEKYGNLLYSNETLNQLLTNVNNSSEINDRHEISSKEPQYENYSSIFH